MERSAEKKSSRRWFGRFCLIPQLEDPISHSKLQKNVIVATITLSASTAPFASCILFPSFDALVNHFQTTTTQVALTTTVFVLGLAIAPLWWSSLSQRYGRRPVLVFALLMSGVAVIICGVSDNLSMITAFRFLEAVGCSSAQTVGAGVISDIYISTERGTALSWFWLGTLAGSIVSPIIGGALQGWFDWQANMYCTAILTFSAAMLTFLIVPETFVNPITITTHAHAAPASMDLKSLMTRMIRNAVAPLHSLKYLLVPPILLCILYVSICFGSLYCITTTLPYAFSAAPYNFSAVEVGLCYISNCLGYAVGSLVGGRLSDAKLRRYQDSHNGKIKPSERLHTVWYGVIFIPVGLILYGWLAVAKTFWTAPLVGVFLFSLGLMLVTSTITPFLVDAVPADAGAAVVANLNLTRYLFAAVGVVMSPIACDAVGLGWWMAILAILCATATGFVGIVIWKDTSRKEDGDQTDVV